MGIGVEREWPALSFALCTHRWRLRVRFATLIPLGHLQDKNQPYMCQMKRRSGSGSRGLVEQATVVRSDIKAAALEQTPACTSMISQHNQLVPRGKVLVAEKNSVGSGLFFI